MPAPIDTSAQPQGLPQPALEGYERSDLQAKWVFGFFLLLFVGGIVIHFIIAGQLNHLKKEPTPADSWTGAKRVARNQAAPARDFPRLQSSPPADLEAYRARE